jgi:phosphoglycolate phosphatase
MGFQRPGLAKARLWIGDGIDVLVERGLTAALGARPDPDQLQWALASFHRCYSEHLYTDSTLYPGVSETLSALRDAGILLGCVTNKREAYALQMLEFAGIARYLSFVYGGDTFARKKPDPLPLQHASEKLGVVPEAAVLIGDSLNDRDAACSAGFEFIFAAYGYGPASNASLRQGFGTINAFAELSALLCAD